MRGSRWFKVVVVTAIVILLLEIVSVAFAETYQLSWYTIDGGGGQS